MEETFWHGILEVDEALGEDGNLRAHPRVEMEPVGCGGWTCKRKEAAGNLPRPPWRICHPPIAALLYLGPCGSDGPAPCQDPCSHLNANRIPRKLPPLYVPGTYGEGDYLFSSLVRASHACIPQLIKRNLCVPVRPPLRAHTNRAGRG